MPTYNYFCHDCLDDFSVTVHFSEYRANANPQCPNCEKNNTTREYTYVPSVSYSGDGWTNAQNTERKR